jgi:adenylate cyclase
MNESTLRESLRRVQEIIAGEHGAPLQGEAEKQLVRILRNATGGSGDPLRNENFSSREVTILLADLRGFTSMSAAHPAGIVLKVLNQFLLAMSEIVFRHQGTIDKFMGDCIMVLFGAPVARKDDARRALACAVDMQLAMDGLNRENSPLGTPELYLGVGINTGTVMAGLIGSDLYSEYTVIGHEVNLASRIEAFSLRGQVLISQSSFDRCRDYVQTGEPVDVMLKGKARPVSLREVLAIPSLGKTVPRHELRKSPRVNVKIPFTYQVIQNNIVMPELHQGKLLDISYHGGLADLGQKLEPYSEIKLDLDLSLIDYRATDVYAKILKTQKIEDRYRSGIEFTSVGDQAGLNIRHFVQLLIQGSEHQ